MNQLPVVTALQDVHLPCYFLAGWVRKSASLWRVPATDCLDANEILGVARHGSLWLNACSVSVIERFRLPDVAWCRPMMAPHLAPQRWEPPQGRGNPASMGGRECRTLATSASLTITVRARGVATSRARTRRYAPRPLFDLAVGMRRRTGDCVPGCRGRSPQPAGCGRVPAAACRGNPELRDAPDRTWLLSCDVPVGGSACSLAAWVGAAVGAPCAFSREGVLSHHAEG
jgi:hypothetical protein